MTEEEIDAYFDGTVFVGDSVMLGFRNYALQQKDTWLGKPQFLASVSYSLYSAMKAPGYKLHPVYGGQKRQIWESISMMGAKRVFLFFGLNDINITGINGTRDYYIKVAEQIKALSPEIEIHLMSMTNTVAGRRNHNLYNDNIRNYNATMRQLAEEQGWGFVDVATPLTDANGDLIAQYCSDKDVHLTNAAYAVWASVLRDYARTEIEKRKAAEEAPKGTAGPAGPGGGTEQAAGPGSAGGQDGTADGAAGPRTQETTGGTAGPGTAGKAADPGTQETTDGTEGLGVSETAEETGGLGTRETAGDTAG